MEAGAGRPGATGLRAEVSDAGSLQGTYQMEQYCQRGAHAPYRWCLVCTNHLIRSGHVTSQLQNMCLNLLASTACYSTTACMRCCTLGPVTPVVQINPDQNRVRMVRATQQPVRPHLLQFGSATGRTKCSRLLASYHCPTTSIH